VALSWEDQAVLEANGLGYPWSEERRALAALQRQHRAEEDRQRDRRCSERLAFAFADILRERGATDVRVRAVPFEAQWKGLDVGRWELWDAAMVRAFPPPTAESNA
jgi:hypothetical protein